MHRIPQSTITAIRSDKQQGNSLKEIALQYGIAKATVSYYCRDLFSHPSRKYQTEVEVRKHGTERAKRFTCRICGSPTKSKNGLCGSCYQRSRPHNTDSHHKKHKLYPCRECKTNLTRKPDGLCLSCYGKLLAERRNNLVKEQEQGRENRQAYFSKLDAKAKEQSRCQDSPSGAHYWLVNSDNIGTCRYCHHQKDFTTNKLKPQKRAVTTSDSTSASLNISQQPPPFIITKEPLTPELAPLDLRERYLLAWCRITCSLIGDGLNEYDVILVCNATIKNTDKTYTARQVASLEKEASQYPPIPEHIHKQLLLNASSNP